MTRAGYDNPPNWMQDAPVITELSSTTPVAAKDHACNGCKNMIAKGTQHTSLPLSN